MLRKNVAGQYLYFALVNASTGAALTGATVTGKRSIDGAAQASVTGTISEDAGGQYHLALSQADTNGNNIGFLFTATSAIPVSLAVITTAADPTDAAAFGLSRLDAAVSSRSTYSGGAVASVTAGVTVTTNNDKTGYGLSAAAVQAIWDALTSALTTAGSIGKRIVDYLTGDAYARIGAAGAGLTAIGDTRMANLDATVSSRNATTPPTVAAIRTEMDANSTKLANLDAAVSSRSTYSGGAVASVTAAVTVGTNNDKTGYGLSAAAVQAIWDALTSALTTAGSIGKRIVDYLTGDAYARIGAAGAGLTAIGDARMANLDATVSSRNATAPPTTAAIAVAVVDQTLSGHTTAGTVGGALQAAGSAGDPWSTPLPGAYAVGTAGKIVGTNLDATVSSRNATTPPTAAAVRAEMDSNSTKLANLDVAVSTRLATSGYTAPDNTAVLAAIAAVPAAVWAVTTRTLTSFGTLVADAAAAVWAAVTRTLTSGSSGGATAAEVAAAVVDQTLTGHTTSGTVGGALLAAGVAGDPWTAPLPGAYGAGTAGAIVGGLADPGVTPPVYTASAACWTSIEAVCGEMPGFKRGGKIADEQIQVWMRSVAQTIAAAMLRRGLSLAPADWQQTDSGSGLPSPVGVLELVNRLGAAARLASAVSSEFSSGEIGIQKNLQREYERELKKLEDGGYDRMFRPAAVTVETGAQVSAGDIFSEAGDSTAAFTKEQKF